MEEPIFSFLYVPYYDGENDFLQLLAFLVEKIDYDDSELVECVYKMYEQVERNGAAYLQEQIFKDVKVLEHKKEKKEQPSQPESRKLEVADPWENVVREQGNSLPDMEENTKVSGKTQEQEVAAPRRIFSLFDTKKNKKGKEQEKREEYQESMQRLINGYAVAEETTYEEEYGRTTFLSQKPEKKESTRRLYFMDGRRAADLGTGNLLIGKYKEKVDLYLSDESVSRMHARLLRDAEDYYLEDENSTNGTYCNKTRLQPYERLKLEIGDEIQVGNVTLYFR